MKTRKQYLDKECTYNEYYEQFVTGPIRYHVESCIGKDRILASQDKNLNDIPLAEWDAAAKSFPASNIDRDMRAAGDYPTLAGLVCIAKTAARELIE